MKYTRTKQHYSQYSVYTNFVNIDKVQRQNAYRIMENLIINKINTQNHLKAMIFGL